MEEKRKLILIDTDIFIDFFRGVKVAEEAPAGRATLCQFVLGDLLNSCED